MPEFAGLGTSLVLIVAVVLWVAYLVPVWTRKREYLATERNAIRLQQTLRIMAESQEAPEEVRLEVDARTVAVQQKAVAKEQRLKQALEHAKAVARARELDEQIKAVEREVRAAVKSSMSRTQRLRRTRLACFALVLVALLGVVAGALLPGMQVLVAVGAVVAVLGVVGLVAVNASAQRMRRVAASTAPQVRTVVEARKVAAEAVAAEERMAEQVVARQSGRIARLATAEVLESRSWSPQPVPEQRVRVEYKASDDLLQRAREQLAADRRALSGPVARVTRLEPSFEEIVTGEIAQTETERRLAPTQPAVPIRELPVQEAVAQAEALDVVRAELPLETQQDEHPIRREQPVRRAPATSGSRFASMGLIDDDLAGVDVHAAFARRVG
ncbi:hypothetical protein [Agrococcus sp. Marseille-Q4369]|uniref:hypothetical protein n=1 Tax=Agrococcus sp. Marseille-Q4369 TaxID=2810513 RepID=UPI001B8CE190|nr:hypothetical protein [Agrococcus sp. Marseille-Q4369]QUW19822.1 hypothetical protein JSQ78_05950 [Agrococcus sp. Marseille-Q4369]